jgi:hypothetical protein
MPISIEVRRLARSLQSLFEPLMGDQLTQRLSEELDSQVQQVGQVVRGWLARRSAGGEKSGANTPRRSPASKTAQKASAQKASAQDRPAQDRPARRAHKASVTHKAPQIAPQKILWAGGGVATLALLAVVPTRVASQAIAQSSCQEIVQSGAEVSRDELARLLALPVGATHEAGRAAVNMPYCMLPEAEQKLDSTAAQPGETVQSPQSLNTMLKAQDKAAANSIKITREAYPLAFDPSAWVVVNYAASPEAAGEYLGYDFVFKP